MIRQSTVSLSRLCICYVYTCVVFVLAFIRVIPGCVLVAVKCPTFLFLCRNFYVALLFSLSLAAQITKESAFFASLLFTLF